MVGRRERIRAVRSTPGGPDESLRREVLVEESGRPYWLPVQEALWPGVDAELKSGDEAERFVRVVGRERGDVLVLVNAFDPL